MHKRAQLHHLNHFIDAGFDVCLVPAQHLEGKADVFNHRHMREQGEALKDGVHGTLVRWQVFDFVTIKVDGASRGVLKPCNHPQQGGFATTGRPQQGEKFIVRNVEGNIADRRKVTEILADIAQRYGGGR